jgi:hypothetical protein
MNYAITEHPMVGEKLQGSKAVRLITSAKARMAGGVGSHSNPGQQRGEELVGKGDAVLKGGDEGAGELHGITAKLLEGLL